MVDGHAQQHADGPQQGKLGQIPPGNVYPRALFQGAPGKGDQKQAPHQKPGKGHLHGVKMAGHQLEGDLHGAEDDSGPQNIEETLLTHCNIPFHSVLFHGKTRVMTVRMKKTERSIGAVTTLWMPRIFVSSAHRMLRMP